MLLILHEVAFTDMIPSMPCEMRRGGGGHTTAPHHLCGCHKHLPLQPWEYVPQELWRRGGGRGWGAGGNAAGGNAAGISGSLQQNKTRRTKRILQNCAAE